MNRRHGGPFDRGMSDSYYRRPRRPHYFPGATMHDAEIPEADMTAKQITEYHAGFDYNQYEICDFKEWV